VRRRFSNLEETWRSEAVLQNGRPLTSRQATSASSLEVDGPAYYRPHTARERMSKAESARETQQLKVWECEDLARSSCYMEVRACGLKDACMDLHLFARARTHSRSITTPPRTQPSASCPNDQLIDHAPSHPTLFRPLATCTRAATIARCRFVPAAT
jgi:hypothetical protein